MGTATSKVKATVGKLGTQVGAALTGKPGILRTLEGEHTELTTLIADVRDAKHVQRRRDLYPMIRRELMIHGQGEEHGLYAECRAHDVTRPLAEQATRDHMAIEQLLATLDGAAIGSPEWLRNFDELARVVERHFALEERELFPAAKDALGNDALRELDGRYKAHRKRLDQADQPLEPRWSQTA